MPRRAYEPIPYDEWAEANPHLCEFEQCPECDGDGVIDQPWCECPDCGDHHHREPFRCTVCRGVGEIDRGRLAYEEQLRTDRQRWTMEFGWPLAPLLSYPAGRIYAPAN